eukprot:7384181-Prymnesium_polylepis.1
MLHAQAVEVEHREHLDELPVAALERQPVEVHVLILRDEHVALNVGLLVELVEEALRTDAAHRQVVDGVTARRGAPHLVHARDHAQEALDLLVLEQLLARYRRRAVGVGVRRRSPRKRLAQVRLRSRGVPIVPDAKPREEDVRVRINHPAGTDEDATGPLYRKALHRRQRRQEALGGRRGARRH